MMALTRRDFLCRAAGAGVSLALSGCAVTDRSSSRPKTNIVFILIDDLGWADLPSYGHPFHETPGIDRLAGEGMRFTDAYAACPVCSPTRASILSGQYPARLGVIDFISGHWRPFEKLRVPKNHTQFLPLEIITLAEALQAAGYTCGAFGKWHLGGREHFPDRQGFDEMLVHRGPHFDFKTTPALELDPDAYTAETLTDYAERFIDTNRDKPFFLYLSHYAVHIPLQARVRLVEKYEKKSKPPSGINHPVYAAMIEHVDESVGRILDKLDALNLAGCTMVVFFSDNGGLKIRFDGKGDVVTTNSPLRDEKGTLYEGGIRVPLIVRWTGRVEPASVCTTPVTSVDFYPTFLELAGSGRSDQQTLDGRSLVPLLKRQPSGLEDRAIYWHYPVYHHSTPASAVRHGRWKLVEFFEDGRLELYDLANDVSEESDLAEKRSDKARELHDLLKKWRQSVQAPMPVMNPDFDQDRRYEWGRHPDRK
jgi:uncharacterized sulfatase